MKSQTVQHSRCTLHHTKNGDGQEKPKIETTEDGEDAQDTSDIEDLIQGHFPQDERQLLMGK